MRLAVLGASGKTGQELVRQAIARGHAVTALVRRQNALDVRSDRIELIVGDARDPGIIETILARSDAVVCSLGATLNRDENGQIDDAQRPDVCAVSTRLLFEAMPRNGIRRVVLMSTHGAGSSNDGSSYVRRLRGLVHNRIVDKDEMELFIVHNGGAIDWTVIRNPPIYDGPQGSPFGVYETIELDRSARVTYADLAGFALDAIETSRHVGQFLTITEPLHDAALMTKAVQAREDLCEPRKLFPSDR